jgi:hypothetical protein
LFNIIYSLLRDQGDAAQESGRLNAYHLGINKSFAPGIFRRTQILTITPRFVVVNGLQNTISIRQVPSAFLYGSGGPLPESTEVILEPGETKPWFWCSEPLPEHRPVAREGTRGQRDERTKYQRLLQVSVFTASGAGTAGSSHEKALKAPTQSAWSCAFSLKLFEAGDVSVLCRGTMQEAKTQRALLAQQLGHDLLSNASDASGGKPAAIAWKRDEDSEACAICARPWTLTNRRHHCRACGEIICKNCSSVPLLGERICSACVLKKEELHGKTADGVVGQPPQTPSSRAGSHPRDERPAAVVSAASARAPPPAAEEQQEPSAVFFVRVTQETEGAMMRVKVCLQDLTRPPYRVENHTDHPM